jgi:hypothetical protein
MIRRILAHSLECTNQSYAVVVYVSDVRVMIVDQHISCGPLPMSLAGCLTLCEEASSTPHLIIRLTVASSPDFTPTFRSKETTLSLNITLLTMFVARRQASWYVFL